MAPWCAQVSVSRAEIEVGRNPPRSVRCKRTRKSPVAVRHLYPNLGTDGAVRCAGLRASSALRTQITFSSTFPGIHGYLWRVDWFPIEPKRSLAKPLAFVVGSSPTCTDCNRVFRLRGVANCKNDPAFHVTVEYRGDSTWDSEDFRLDVLSSDAILSSRIFTARKHPASPTNLEHGWLWILLELARGKDAAKLTRKLTSRRIDKRNSLYPSPRTTDVASAKLRLGKSISIDDVVLLLKVGGALRFHWHSAVLVRGSPQLIGGRWGHYSAFNFEPEQNGASHRENFDTPPLEGNCRETCECSRGTILSPDR